jgi:hypothetical protein
VQWVWILVLLPYNTEMVVESRRTGVFLSMKHPLRKLLLLGALASAIPAYAAPPTIITRVPFNITVPGKYVLQNNLTLAPLVSVYAILITCSDVIVDLNGYTITGPGGANQKAFGIEESNPKNIIGAISNIVIRNGTLTNFGIAILSFPDNGLAGYGATDSTIENITMSVINSVAISDDDGVGNHIRNCTIISDTNQTVGIVLTTTKYLVTHFTHCFPLTTI